MKFPDNEKLLQAITERHSVRRFKRKPVSEAVLDCLTKEITRINQANNYSFRVVTHEARAFKNIFAYGTFSNAVNYIIISAPEGKEHTRRCGYEGERLVLGLQALKLNTCWVGLSYSKKVEAFHVPKGHKVRCVIAFGYGETQGVIRKSKSVKQLSNADETSPRWFIDAMLAVQLAPTAINQQKFFFTLNSDETVTVKRKFSLAGYTHLDLGIAICHFNLTAPAHAIPI